MPDQNKSLARIASALLLILALLWCVYWFVHAWHYWEDDAYIHLEFARSFASGHGFAFNGRVVAGDSAPLWVFLLAAMHLLIPDWLLAGKLLTVLGTALAFSGTYAFARRLAASILPSSAAATVFPAALVLLLAVNPYFCYWAFSGMESVAASGLACFAVLTATRSQPTLKSFLTASLLIGLAPLLRPEMFFLSALLILPLVGQWNHLSGKPASLSKLAAFASALFLVAAPLTLWSMYSLHAFGHILPNTNAAKRAALTDSVPRHLLTIYSAGFPLILCGLAAGLLYLLLRPSAVRRSLYTAFASCLPISNQTHLRNLIADPHPPLSRLDLYPLAAHRDPLLHRRPHLRPDALHPAHRSRHHHRHPAAGALTLTACWPCPVYRSARSGPRRQSGLCPALYPQQGYRLPGHPGPCPLHPRAPPAGRARRHVHHRPDRLRLPTPPPRHWRNHPPGCPPLLQLPSPGHVALGPLPGRAILHDRSSARTRRRPRIHQQRKVRRLDGPRRALFHHHPSQSLETPTLSHPQIIPGGCPWSRF